MPAQALAGREVADAVLAEVRARLDTQAYTPRLVFIRVGEDPASAYYVRSKERLAKRAGIDSEVHALPEATAAAELFGLIERLNEDPAVDGILLQLPLPPHLDSGAFLEAIRPDKDVDGLHPVNVGRLWSGQDGLFPCTPVGLLRILDHYGIEVAGRRAVIVGRSNLVGKPAAALLLRRDATVTVAHSRTRDLGALTREAEILIAATGRPGLVTAEMVAPGATVLDVGLSRVEGRVVGDVDPAVAEVAGALTPMPGGTGLVTVAMVIANTVRAAALRREAGGSPQRGADG